MSIIPSAAPNNTSPAAPMTPGQYSHIRAHLSEAARKFGGIDYVSPTFGLVRDAMAEVDRLRAELAESQRQKNWLDRHYARQIEQSVQLRDELEQAQEQFNELSREVSAVGKERAEQAARIVQLENALAATGRSLSSFIFDSDDPGADALGAQWLYSQAMPNADDPFAQPRAFRSSVFSEASKAVEELDAHTPDDRSERPQSYLDGYSDGLQEAAESLEKLADQAAEGSEVAS